MRCVHSRSCRPSERDDNEQPSRLSGGASDSPARDGVTTSRPVATKLISLPWHFTIVSPDRCTATPAMAVSCPWNTPTHRSYQSNFKIVEWTSGHPWIGGRLRDSHPTQWGRIKAAVTIVLNRVVVKG